MADEIDRANDQAQRILEKHIASVDTPINPYQNDSGVCWECGRPVPDRRRWCSVECCSASQS